MTENSAFFGARRGVGPPDAGPQTAAVRRPPVGPTSGDPAHTTFATVFIPSPRLISFKHQGQRQHPPRCIGIIAAGRHLAKRRRRVIGARDC